MTNKIAKTILGIFLGLFILASISASMAVSYNVAYGIIEDNGSLNATSTPVIGSAASVYTCLNSACTSAGSLVTTASTSTSLLTITFPEVLQSSYGYVIYVYKTGYVGWEQINVIRYGNGATTSSTIFYLSKNRNGYAPINSLNLQNLSSNITITSNISTSSQKKTTSNIPLSETVLNNVRLDISNSTGIIHTENGNISIDYSSSIIKSFNYSNLACGNYTLTLTTLPVDAKILNPQQRLVATTFNVLTGCSGNNTNQTNSTLPTLTVINPLNGYTYNNTLIILNVSANQAITTWLYNLNNAGNLSFIPGNAYNLPLINGTNNLIFSGTNSNGTGTAIINFIYNSTSNQTGPVNNTNSTLPSINITSPKAGYTYNTTNILLNATSNQIVNWSYNLNNGINTTFIPGTIYNLSLINGTNTIIIYGTNSNGTGSQTITFTYNSSSGNNGVCIPNWIANSWGSCHNGKKTRTYFDINNCNNNTGKPGSDEKSCGTNDDDDDLNSSKPLNVVSSLHEDTGYSNYTIVLGSKKQTSEFNLVLYWLIVLILLILILIILIYIYKFA